MRFFLALSLSIIICLGLFFGMFIMTNSNNKKFEEQSELRHLVYLRDKDETKIERKKRIQEKPKVKKLEQKPKFVKKYSTEPEKNVKIVPFKIQQKIEISKISSLSGAKVILDANTLAPLKKVNPKYPRHAKSKKQEGYVKLIFDIGKDGYVSNVRVVESNPEGVFENSSISAIKRWKFNRSEYSKTATIKFNFRLAR
ncbi:TonB family protein [Arcobacter nitrofigilis DSM 7299]|uniref:TonB family protein n=2 Tax=Arcobacter nitrofigilis TaxID=28199 RepID=D5UZJ1_ARCNC|nr:TonB family protein [Arcobacter nitrofigilis DSM 7299]